MTAPAYDDKCWSNRTPEIVSLFSHEVDSGDGTTRIYWQQEWNYCPFCGKKARTK